MNDKIENLLEENRKFTPKTDLSQNANATSEWFDESNENRLEFLKKQALERITWFKEPTEILDSSNPPFFKWFKDCLLYTSPSPRDLSTSRMPSSA